MLRTALRNPECIGPRENLVVCAPSGTGKSMFSTERPSAKPR
jgi:hypothetical protein